MTEWIPIKERRPEKEGEYIIKFKDEKMHPEISMYFPDTDTWHVRPISKSVQLFNKSLIFGWSPFPEMPKKKRWRPEKGENVYGIRSDGKVLSGPWCNIEADNKARDFLGTYKNMSEALTMIDKIKAFVTSEIGEP